jgi:HD-GYP domain-containing protein (c-di-GMP phosphodiesterase class II)/pSer/pThr/pTyr-binding forkhead associated (FHA) protein
MNAPHDNQPTLRIAELVVLEYGRSRQNKFGLGSQNIVGRQSECDIQLLSHQVSRRHAQINANDKSWTIQDLNSANGTFINGHAISGKHPLRSGDRIIFGDVLCVFQETTSPLEALVGTVATGDHPANSAPTQFIPIVPSQFMPQGEIKDESVLREDYEKLRITYELQKEIGSDINLDSLLEKILLRAFELLDCDQGVILLNNEQGQLKPRAFKSLNPSAAKVISSTLVSCVQERQMGIIWADILADERFNRSDSLIMRGVRSSMAVPILDDGQFLGAIIIEAFGKVGAFTEKDLNLVTTIANHACQFIKNSLLHSELKRSFDSAITTLSAVVDARHPLTAGHSERVAFYAHLIGTELRLDDDRMEVLRLAALLHDIGKIGIRDKILLKKGPFAADEREEMNAHALMTRNILDKFYFPHALKSIPAVAALHHERYDGSGYPEGLTGEALPLETRILTIADIFDALTSRRDYPKYDIHQKEVDDGRLPLAEAIGVIEEKSGIYFDPAVVTAFKRCLPRALLYYRGQHFEPEYVDPVIRSMAPELFVDTKV